MSFRPISALLLFLLVALLSTVPRPARSELVHGILTIYGDWYYTVFCGEMADFSEQIIVPQMSIEGDLCYAEDKHGGGPWFLLAKNSARILLVDETLEELLVAPPHAQYKDFLGLFPGRTYVILTGDGFYAKLALRDFKNALLTIEYYIQMDGTTNLDQQRVPVHSTTWGRVKALYAE